MTLSFTIYQAATGEYYYKTLKDNNQGDLKSWVKTKGFHLCSPIAVSIPELMSSAQIHFNNRRVSASHDGHFSSLKMQAFKKWVLPLLSLSLYSRLTVPKRLNW